MRSMSKPKKKGASSSRSRAHAKREPESDEPPVVDLEEEMRHQRATQHIAEKYDKEIRKMRAMHEREMNSIIQGMSEALTSKPSLWARLTGRYKDIYIIFNHNLPVWCSKKSCPTRREGINFGIEAITTDLGVAFDALRHYFERGGDLDYAHAKLLHVQVDRRRCQCAVVEEMSWTWPLWRNSDHFDDMRKIRANTVQNLIKRSP